MLEITICFKKSTRDIIFGDILANKYLVKVCLLFTYLCLLCAYLFANKALHLLRHSKYVELRQDLYLFLLEIFPAVS